jgi:hypothetical protein
MSVSSSIRSALLFTRAARPLDVGMVKQCSSVPALG